MLTNKTTGDIFVAGQTASGNFPTTNPRQAGGLGGSQDGFLQKLNSSGSTIWSSYFKSASSKSSAILCMEFNTTQSKIYFGGITGGLNSSNISSLGVYNKTYGGGTNDFFVVRMDTSQNFNMSTYLGGSNNEVNMMGLNVDLNNDVYIFGYSNSTNFPVTADALQSALNLTGSGSNNDKTFTKLRSDLDSLDYSTYYGGTQDDYDPVGERGIKFSNCRIYTIVTSESNDIPLTQGAITTTRTSSSSVYEPGLVVWANPPDLLGNTISGNQSVCSGGVPSGLSGSVPTYSLPNISRNSVISTYPVNYGSAASYEWQSSTDSINWTDINNATTQNLAGSLIGPIFKKTYFRRIIHGDACVLADASGQTVTVSTLIVPATVNNVSCFGSNNGYITANPTNGTAPYHYAWANGATTSTISNLSPGSYKVTVTDGAGCTVSSTFSITQTVTAISATKASIPATCVLSDGSAAVSVSGGVAPYTYLWSNGAITSSISAVAQGIYTVTIKDSNNCSVQVKDTVAINNTTNANAGQDAIITCVTGPQISLTGSSTTSGVTYSWAASGGGNIVSGANTTNPVVNAAGIYVLTVSKASNGCVATDTAIVTLNNTPPTVNITANGGLTFCQGGSVTLSASGGVSYLWSTGATASSIIVSAQGNYTVKGTDAKSCNATSAGTTVTVNPNPSINISLGDPTTFCEGGSVTLSASGATSYLWSNGATTSSISVGASGIYSVTGKNGNGCSTASAGTSVTVNSNPNINISLGGNSNTFCQGNSVTLSASGGISYLWSTGATTSSISVSTTGIYSVIGSNGNQCNAASAGTSITVNPNPTINISLGGGQNTFCEGNSVTLNASGGISYLWSTGATTSSIVVNTTGVYSVIGTNGNQCNAASAGTSITVNPNPTINISLGGGQNTFCEGNSVTLTASGGISYLWSTRATTSSIVVNKTGIYSVIGTNGNQCNAASAGTSITVNPNPTINISLGGGQNTFCEGNSVRLTASGGISYLWSTGATTSSIVVSKTGIYSVIGTNGNQCNAVSAGTSITVNPNPNINISLGGGQDTFCEGNSVTLTASGGLSYIWSTGATTSSIVVNATGVYSVVGTNGNQCHTASAGTSITVNPNPTINISLGGGQNTFCEGNFVTLTASGGISYLWSTGATTSSIVVSKTGIYSVIGTNGNQCNAASAGTSITVNPNPNINISLGGGQNTFCEGNSVTLTASGGLSYLWSTGATTSSIVVNTTGVYSVIGTNGNQCNAASAGTSITVNPNPVINISLGGGQNTFCEGNSVTLTASGGISYLWSTGASTSSIVVNTTGIYSVIGTNGNQCNAASAGTSITVNPNPNINISLGGGQNTFCEGNSVTLTASGGISYLWSTGATTSSIVVNTTGIYSVIGTNGNQCNAASAGTSITVNPNTNINISLEGGPNTFCEGNSATLTGSGGISYLWSTGATTSSIVVNTTGVYSVIGTNGNQCNAASAGTSITVNPNPVINISLGGGPNTFCEGNAATLTASGGISYLWSTGATTSSIVVSKTGIYSVIGTNGNQCNGASAGTSITVNPNPVINISLGGGVTNSTAAFCQGNSAKLLASGGNSYLWSTGATTSSITVSTAGIYSVIGINGNQCSASSAGTSITVYANPMVSINPLSICEGQSGNICATSTGSSLTYLWNSGFTSPCYSVGAPGHYSVVVTDVNGCKGASSVDVGSGSPPNVTVVPSGSTSFCQGDSVTLTAGGAGIYIWNTGTTGSSLKVKSNGLYSVTGTNSSGCQLSVLVYVTVYPLPVVSIAPLSSASLCQGGSVTLLAGGAATYIWSTNQNGLEINVNTTGAYAVTGTDGNGCKASANTNVTVNPLPVVTFSAPGPACLNAGVITLNGGSPAGGIYSGAGVTGSSFDPVKTGGTSVYPLTYSYTNVNGCSNSAASSITVVTVPNKPGGIIGPITGVCVNTTQNYSIAPVAGAVSYTWTPLAGSTIISGQGTTSISVKFGSSRVTNSLSVIAVNGCGNSSSASVTITSVPATPAVIYGDHNPCKREFNLYWVDAIPGAASYVWSVPAGTTIISGQGTDTIAITTGSGSGNLTVFAVNGCGTGGTASIFLSVACRIMDTTRVASDRYDFNAVFYPNPAHEVLNVVFNSPDENDYSLKIFDMTGRLVMDEMKKADMGNNVVELNLNFVGGIYIVSLTSGELNKKAKIIVE